MSNIFPLLGSCLLAATLLAGCARPPELIGVDSTATPAASVVGATRHRIFIASTRKSSAEVGALYSGNRAPSLSLASVDVTVPPTHVTGQLERPKRLPPDPRTEFAVIDPAMYDSDTAFINEMNREFAKRPPSDRKVLLFVHGYNTNASDAVLRLAQFVEDTEYKGVAVSFTWASAAKLSRYVYDLNSALIARRELKHIAGILSRTEGGSLDILAHSMGNLLTMEGLVDAAQAGTLGTRGKIDHIMLASPDIDMDLFRSQIAQLPRPVVNKMYILISKDDSALRASRRIAGGIPRVGAANAPELEALGPTVIDLSQVEDSSSGSHTKFAGSPEVVKLIGAGLRNHGRFGEQTGFGLGDLIAGAPIQIFQN